jgi:hypothetical protein
MGNNTGEQIQAPLTIAAPALMRIAHAKADAQQGLYGTINFHIIYVTYDDSWILFVKRQVAKT